jgi:hypothetical protein
MNWNGLKDSMIVLVIIFSSFLLVKAIDKFNEIEKRLVRIETVLILKGIMPEHLAVAKEEKAHQP